MIMHENYNNSFPSSTYHVPKCLNLGSRFNNYYLIKYEIEIVEM